MPFNRITTANLAPLQAPRVNFSPMTEDPAMASFEKARAQSAAENKASMDRQIQAMEKMLENPTAAPQIAQMYGLSYTPQMDALFKDRQKAALVVEGAKIVKDMGVDNPAAATKFIQGYASSNGDLNQALGSIGNAPMLKPTRGHAAGTATTADVNSVVKPQGTLDMRMDVEYPTETEDGAASIDPESKRQIQEAMLQRMRYGADFEDAYAGALQDVTGGAGLELYDPGWFSDEVWRVPGGGKPAAVSQPAAPAAPTPPRLPQGGNALPSPKTPQEVAALPSGTKFIAPNGSVKIKP